jgi:phosphatidylglycerophosphate synthase
MLEALRRPMEPLVRGAAWPFVALRVPPNALTLLSVASAAGAAWLTSERAWLAALGVAAATGLLDMLDGAVARARNRVTSFGGFLDSVADRVVDLFLLFGFGLALDDRWGWILVALGAAGSYGTSYARARAYEDVHVPRDAWGAFFERPERMLFLLAALAAQAAAERAGFGDGMLLAILGVFAAATWVTLVQRVLRVRRLLRRA